MSVSTNGRKERINNATTLQLFNQWYVRKQRSRQPKEKHMNEQELINQLQSLLKTVREATERISVVLDRIEKRIDVAYAANPEHYAAFYKQTRYANGK